MFPEPFSASQIRGRRSSALVITLAALVLVCAIILVFFNQSTLSRQVSFSSAGEYRADLVAHTALDTITGDLRTEIAAGSTAYTSNNITLYLPTTNLAAAPSRVGDQNLSNLVKQSTGGSGFWTGTYFNADVTSPIRSVLNNSTKAPSANGRFIAINQWNKTGLLGDPGSGTIPTVPGTYTTPPDWVLVTRQGAVSNVVSLPAIGPGSGTLSDRTVGNANYVVGRYAYTIYDEGGLLDVNVAGRPSSIPGNDDFATKRGLLSQMDLASIPGVSDAGSIVTWRNQATAASATSYTNYVFTTTNGFTTVAPGDQAFVSRRDLIHYAQANPGQLATSALQYLGTFTRELNAPSFTADPNRAKIQSSYATYGLPYALDDQFNPSLINTRVTGSFSRNSDGTTAQPGEPLIKYRFPLTRLGWFSSTPPSATLATQIYDSFGLTWSSTIPANAEGGATSGWVYNHGDPTRIYKLSDIAGAREPDFFELLQAAIDVGSLGKGVGTTEASNTTGIDSDDYYQILSIGANIIDQYNTSSYPTVISFNPPPDVPGFVLCGKKNLPYISRLLFPAMRIVGNAGGYVNPYIGGWIQLEMWNPCAQAQTPSSTGPTQFRVVAEGTTYMAAFYSFNYDYLTIGPDQALNFNNSSINFTVSAANNFSQPTLLAPNNAQATGMNVPSVPAAVSPFLGIFQGEVFAPDNRNQAPPNNMPNFSPSAPNPPVDNDPPNPPVIPYEVAAARSGSSTDPAVSTYVTFYAQYRDASQNWVTYQVMPYELPAGNTADETGFNNSFSYCWQGMPDPRCNRFGRGANTVYGAATDTLWPSLTTQYSSSGESSNGYPGWTVVPDAANPGRYFMGGISVNTSAASLTHYVDPDGVLRGADGVYNDGTTDGLPLINGNYASRPYQLNRPFRSVADLGYVDRDMPWKQLDFFSSSSGDGALLDLFSLNESPLSGIVAGVLDLNTRQSAVLSSVLQGAIQAEDTDSTISSADATSIAQAIVGLTSNQSEGPLQNRSDLVTRGSSLFTYSAGGETNIIKRQREAGIRALAGVGSCRTWNLLIDVIAQSGRYPAKSPAGTSLNQFVVEGERRYWLHVAIDRYTGKVIDHYLESVNE